MSGNVLKQMAARLQEVPGPAKDSDVGCAAEAAALRTALPAALYPLALGGAAVRCREVLGTPIGLPPLKRKGPRRSTPIELS